MRVVSQLPETAKTF